MKEDLSKEDYVLLAKLAQQTERYDEMVLHAEHLLLHQQELTSGERKLCASAYKNVIANRRAEMEVLESVGKRIKETEAMAPALREYSRKIRKQTEQFCLNALRLIEGQIIPAKYQIKSGEAKIFFLKMRADLNRYLCQFTNQSNYLQTAESLYEEAEHLAQLHLPQTNPTRLALHFNMSLFFAECKRDEDRALRLANRAYEEALANIDSANEEEYKDCATILQLMRDNITLWSEGKE